MNPYHLFSHLIQTKKKTKLINKRLQSAEYRAKTKNIKFNLTFKDILDKLAQQNGRCYFTNEPLSFNKKDPNVISFDRGIPIKGYSKENLNLVTALVNKTKSDTPTDEFIKLCGKIYNNRKNIKYPNS